MHLLYNLVVNFSEFILEIIALFNNKIRLFVEGRKKIFPLLEKEISKKDNVIWIHCASLGEFEQGAPIIEGLNKMYLHHKIVLTFFSPSGYEIKKKYKYADVVSYLPLDTTYKSKKIIKILHPSIVIFVKYEFWPNLLRELKKEAIPTLLISGIFRKNQLFFKSYGQWMRDILKTFSHFFVQDETSLQLLKNINLKNVTLSGDTRFDRVYDILKRNNKLDFMDNFKQNSYLLVAGSTWEKDENMLVEYINNKSSKNEKFIIAPHNIKPETITSLKRNINKKTALFSEKKGLNLKEYQVLIIDIIGILTKIYSYSNVAYVGGGFTKSGIHNILEAAIYGIPIIIGKNYKKYKEAKDLIKLNGCTSIKNQKDFTMALGQLKKEPKKRNFQGNIAKNYIKSELGASKKILSYIESILNC